MLFEKSVKNNGYGFGVFEDEGFASSFNGTVIDGVQKLDENLLTEDLCVSGSAIFSGEVDADRIVIPGRAEFRDFVTCDDINIAGEALLKNELVCESVVVPGDASFLDKIVSDVFIIGGSVKANRKIKTIRLNVDGELESFGKIYADKVLVKGSLVYASEMSCFDLRITSEKQSRAGRIMADKLSVVNRAEDKSEPVLTCDFVECGVANIEYANIDYLRCDSCKIGKGCVIGRLECFESAEISPDAVIEQIITVNSEVL